MPDDPDVPGVADVTRVTIEAELDLHAFAPRDVVSAVEEYVTAAAHAGFREVRVVHGRGRGSEVVQAFRPAVCAGLKACTTPERN